MGADKPAAEEKVGTMMNEVMEYPIQYCAAPHDEKKILGIFQTTIHQIANVERKEDNACKDEAQAASQTKIENCDCHPAVQVQ